MKITHLLCAFALIVFSFAYIAPPVNAAGEVITVKHSKAKFAGRPNCESKYPAAGGQGAGFRHLLTKSCYSCPSGYKRTIFPINAKNACERVVQARSLWKKATYKGSLFKTKPSRAFIDPRNGGEYWSCPAGTHRTVLHAVTSSKACERRARTVYAKASKYRKNSRVGQGCPGGKFWDVKGGDRLLGACYSCPSGYKRSASSVSSSKACYRRISAKLYKAKKHGGVKNPKPAGAFLDPRNKGEYWSCPKGYGRTVVHAVNSSKACKKTIPGKSYAAKSKKRGTFGCRAGAFRNGLENACYTCPKGYSRSAVPGTKLHTRKSACVLVKVDPNKLRNPKFEAWAKKEAVQIKKRYDRDMKQVMTALKKIKPVAMVKSLTNAKTDAQRVRVANRILSPLTKWIVKNGTKKKASLPMRRASILQPVFDGGDRIQVADTSTSTGLIFAKFGIDKPKLPTASETIKNLRGDALDRAIRNALAFKTTSVAIIADASFVVGGTLTPMMLAIDNVDYARKVTKTRKKQFYNAAAASVGNSAGADGGIEVGLWRDDYAGLSGGSFGMVGAASIKGGLGITLWWSTDKKPRFLGIAIATQIGLSAEMEFTAGGTWKRGG